MLEWINEDFFWAVNTVNIFNANQIDGFRVKEDDGVLPHKFWVGVDLRGSYIYIASFNTRLDAINELTEFLKNKPSHKSPDKSQSKISLN